MSEKVLPKSKFQKRKKRFKTQYELDEEAAYGKRPLTPEEADRQKRRLDYQRNREEILEYRKKKREMMSPEAKEKARRRSREYYLKRKEKGVHYYQKLKDLRPGALEEAAQNRRERMKNMTPEEKEAHRKYQAKVQKRYTENLSPEGKERLRQMRIKKAKERTARLKDNPRYKQYQRVRSTINNRAKKGIISAARKKTLLKMLNKAKKGKFGIIMSLLGGMGMYNMGKSKKAKARERRARKRR